MRTAAMPVGSPMGFRPSARRPPEPLAVLRADASPHDDAGDSDAGADAPDSEFERAIVYDCTETWLCNRSGSVSQCVVSVRKALNTASAQQRQVFMASVGRCRPRRACDYVDCVSPSNP